VWFKNFVEMAAGNESNTVGGVDTYSANAITKARNTLGKSRLASNFCTDSILI